MYEVPEPFGSRKFCGFLKFRPNLRKFMTFQIWKALFERWIFWFSSFGKVDATFSDILRFFPGHVALLRNFFSQPLETLSPIISDFGQFTKVNSSWNVGHFVIHKSLSQKFRNSFCWRKFLPPCPIIFYFFFNLFVNLRLLQVLKLVLILVLQKNKLNKFC